ncbi:MAG: tetrathionate reductase family octaheme c-type cytochrome [Betaproteobacteria bacterium]|nr:tetrathionate reductase family octaheme c-type cytochrome [Betaproteobacteria bacterium]
MNRVGLAGWFFVSTLLAASPVLAAQDHSEFVKGPFKSGPEVTRACLQCHQDQARAFMKTVHWTWSSRQKTPDKGEVRLGKINAVNNFCIALPSNEPRCTSCHAGYGWKDARFDFSVADNVDCLICHDTTGTYKKFPTAAGHPAYTDTEWPVKSGKKWPAVNLEKVAKSVGRPSRDNCGACHFFGGGGDHVKHGDLDSSLAKPERSMDVHMAVDGANMSCVDCHKGSNHVIPGKALSVSLSNGGTTLDCATCHAGTPHQNPRLNAHAEKVACQTCHIPTFARVLPTKVWWDWSTAGQDKPVTKDAHGLATFDKMKGDFKWGKDVMPVYMWFDGRVDRVLMGQKIDAGKLIHLNYPQGRRDKDSKITPFKLMKGKQPFDSVNNVIAVPHLFGKGGFWQTYDWGSAIAAGMKTAGLPYSGQFGWVETDMYWKVNHMVVPKAQALKCDDCHSAGGRMDWKALGYSGDPRELAKQKR